MAKAPRKRAAKAAAPPPTMASVQENIKKFGIYLNAKEKKVVRINSPYWFPPAPEWTIEGGVRVERSTITQSGDTDR